MQVGRNKCSTWENDALCSVYYYRTRRRACRTNKKQKLFLGIITVYKKSNGMPMLQYE